MSTLDRAMADFDRDVRLDAARKEWNSARDHLDEVVTQRIAARARAVAPAAATISFVVENDGDSTLPYPTAIEDAEGNTLIDLLADPELEEAFRGDLEILLEINPDRPDGLFDLDDVPALAEKVSLSAARRRLEEAEAAFEASGGRGIDAAEEIDALRTAIGVAAADRDALSIVVWPYRDGQGHPFVPEGEYLYNILTDVLEAVAEDQAACGVDPVPFMLDELDNLIEAARQVQDRLTKMRFRVVPDDDGPRCAICGRPAGANYHIAGAIPEGENDVVGECCWDERLR